MYNRVQRIFMYLSRQLGYRGKCKECNCGAYDGPDPNESSPYCRCGHHYDRHEY
jgi:hypothetical protein